MAMDSWIETARQAIERSQVVREELRDEAHAMLANGEYAAARRIFEDILEEQVPDTGGSVEPVADSVTARTQ